MQDLLKKLLSLNPTEPINRIITSSSSSVKSLTLGFIVFVVSCGYFHFRTLAFFGTTIFGIILAVSHFYKDGMLSRDSKTAIEMREQNIRGHKDKPITIDTVFDGEVYRAEYKHPTRAIVKVKKTKKV